MSVVDTIVSKGLTAPKAASLGELHGRRQLTSGQFFTPKWVAEGLWSALAGAVSDLKGCLPLSVIDPMCGSGRLFCGAPVNASLTGVDIDSRCIDALIQDAASKSDADNGQYRYEARGIETIDFDGYDVAVLNPAFSILLSSPNLIPFESNSFGLYGPLTSAQSHIYALEMSLRGASVVAAILPSSLDDVWRSYPRLHSVVKLPKNTFVDEGANVATSVYFFSPQGSASVRDYSCKAGDSWPVIPLKVKRNYTDLSPKFRLRGGYDSSKPVITEPTTGNKRVVLHHKGRQRIVLSFSCGLVKAKVLNGLLVGRLNNAEGRRHARSTRFRGSGRLLIPVLLSQDNPESQLTLLCEKINSLGGEAEVSSTLKHYYAKRVRAHYRSITPMYRVVEGASENAGVTLVAKRRTLLDPSDFQSRPVRAGERIQATLVDGAYNIVSGDDTVILRDDMVVSRYDIQTTDLESNAGWMVKHHGLPASFPELANMHSKRIDAAGIDWLADWQRFSLVEGLLNPTGYIGAWEQGTGKARYAIALAMMHSGRSLIVLEPGLLEEMRKEIDKLSIPSSSYGFLGKNDVPGDKSFYITSYTTLRAGKRGHYVKTVRRGGKSIDKVVDKVFRPMGEVWAKTFNTVICDEGGLLANISSQQAKSVKALKAKKLIILDGTPQRSYPRDLLPLSAISAGSGEAHQCFGVSGKPYVEPDLIHSPTHIRRGEDVFFDRHVVTEWVTHEFKEDLQAGGKREVPKINDVALYRTWLAPNVQRRLRSEPDLEDFNNCPEPVYNTLTVDFDDAHFKHYLQVAIEFADWYRSSQESANNLVAVLARIGAVQRAANSCHVLTESCFSLYLPETSKQIALVNLVAEHVGAGKKVIVWAKSPDVHARVHSMLSDRGIDSVLYTGRVSRKKRAERLDRDFRQGNSPVLLASHVGTRGLNIPQAQETIFYDRDWTASSEDQRVMRLLRPDQTEQVNVTYLHFRGSIDEYMAQIVEWKKDSAAVGLDYSDSDVSEDDFLHLDTILSRFCEDVKRLSLRGLLAA
jgi:hypothetical protein